MTKREGFEVAASFGKAKMTEKGKWSMRESKGTGRLEMCIKRTER